MSNQFDFRNLLGGVNPELLREFFTRRGQLLKVPWESKGKARIAEACRELIRLPRAENTEIQLIFQDIHGLADHRGAKVMAEEVGRFVPKRRDEFIQQPSHMDRALWFYLHVPKQFDQAALFARADALAVGRDAVCRNDLPKTSVKVNKAKIQSLEKELSKFYWRTEMRGRHCKVRHYTRGAETLYFFAYLDDWPDKRMIFKDDGKMIRRSDRFAFQDVFAFCPKSGTLDVMAKGGGPLHLPLQQAFCRAICGIDVGPVDPLRPSYRLGMLLEHRFAYPTDPGDLIRSVHLTRIRLQPISRSEDMHYVEIKFRPRVGRARWLEIIDRDLASHGLSRTTVVVRQATFQIVIAADDGGRDRTLTWNVSIPHTCNLKTRPDEARLIGERCMQLWGINQ